MTPITRTPVEGRSDTLRQAQGPGGAQGREGAQGPDGAEEPDGDQAPASGRQDRGAGSSRDETAPPKRAARIAAAVSIALVGVYVAGTLVIVSPTTPVRGAVVAAAGPYFTQKWNVFAPSIMKTNITFSVQAQWRDADGTLVKSDWVNVTKLEQQAVPGHAEPSRIQKSSWNAMLAYNARYLALDAQQREIVRDTFIQRADGGGYRAQSAESLIADLDAVSTTPGSGQGDVVRFLRYDYMLKEYATAFSTAYFDQDVERVRWRIDRTRPNDFENRFSEEQQFDDTAVTFGWRHVDDVIDPETLAVYRDVVTRYGGAR
ncbi:hypothetical protein PlfCFBP13513_16055 [Plantibacter flavus]|uniref:DUF5819 family protein n=1 Tax=Plantibacter flavus TaxID=150123 RepID=UPI0010C18143|nr:DUF5819 family protein [Plantibacter flavus]TKJ96914.1 hypothetical protein PlfCFBP13513_16055 [Plantibacter flavus]